MVENRSSSRHRSCTPKDSRAHHTCSVDSLAELSAEPLVALLLQPLVEQSGLRFGWQQWEWPRHQSTALSPGVPLRRSQRQGMSRMRLR
jgi:hypothetical protein